MGTSNIKKYSKMIEEMYSMSVLHCFRSILMKLLQNDREIGDEIYDIQIWLEEQRKNSNISFFIDLFDLKIDEVKKFIDRIKSDNMVSIHIDHNGNQLPITHRDVIEFHTKLNFLFFIYIESSENKSNLLETFELMPKDVLNNLIEKIFSPSPSDNFANMLYIKNIVTGKIPGDVNVIESFKIPGMTEEICDKLCDYVMALGFFLNRGERQPLQPIQENTTPQITGKGHSDNFFLNPFSIYSPLYKSNSNSNQQGNVEQRPRRHTM